MKNTKRITAALPAARSGPGTDLGPARPNPEVVASAKRVNSLRECLKAIDTRRIGLYSGKT